MGGIDGDWRQHREDVIEEMLLEPRALLVGELICVENVNARFGE